MIHFASAARFDPHNFLSDRGCRQEHTNSKAREAPTVDLKFHTASEMETLHHSVLVGAIDPTVAGNSMNDCVVQDLPLALRGWTMSLERLFQPKSDSG